MAVQIATIEDINRIESKLDTLLSLLDKPIDLKTRDGVRRYLKLSDKQLQYRIDSGKLLEGVHFIKENGRLIFIPEKIKDFNSKMASWSAIK